MTIDELKNKGYTEFTPSALEKAQRACQKRVEDSKGNILYFLTVYMYRREYDKNDRYEVHIQLYQKGTHYPLNLNFFGGWDINDAEKYADFIYYMGAKEQFEPYEIREGNNHDT